VTVRRPFSALASLGTAAHHGFELRAGVGVVFEPWLGRRGAVALWSVLLPSWLLMAVRGSRRWEGLLAFNAGTAFAGALVHFLRWPWSLERGLPTLKEAEGLTDDQLPAYNVILWSWMTAAALALVAEAPRSTRRWAIAGLCMGEPLRRSARHHFAWARKQAQLQPEKWSPALLED
jgi:hypothetical protein